MMMGLKTVLILCLISAALAAAITEQFFPKTRTVEVQHDVIHNDIQTIVKTVKLPSGEIDSTTTIVDHTKRVDTDTRTAISATIPPNWFVAVNANVIKTDFVTPAYGVQVNRRILGPIFVGAQLNTRGEYGLSLGMEF